MQRRYDSELRDHPLQLKVVVMAQDIFDFYKIGVLYCIASMIKIRQEENIE